ncbi:MAG: PfkB family carbohydrate kinase [Gemmatimonadaceae bacterium]
MRIVAVGECTLDRYLDLSLERVGGISLNFAVQARRSGAAHVALVSCTGRDRGAVAVRERLVQEGVDGTHCHAQDGATASQAIRLAAGGERIFPPGGYDPGVLATYHLTDADLRFIGTHDVVAVPFFRQIEHLFWPAVRAVAPGATRVADLLDGGDLGPGDAALDQLLPELDLVFLSAGEEVAAELLPRTRTGHTLIVVTHGAQGSSALKDGHHYRLPATMVPPHACLDSTGCGDAYQAAFTVEYLLHGSVESAMRKGADRAAQVIRHVGATEAPAE